MRSTYYTSFTQVLIKFSSELMHCHVGIISSFMFIMDKAVIVNVAYSVAPGCRNVIFTSFAPLRLTFQSKSAVQKILGYNIISEG